MKEKFAEKPHDWMTDGEGRVFCTRCGEGDPKNAPEECSAEGM
jgi:hypothetical protein